MSREEITVDKAYFESLEERNIFLGCLEAAGVDNWCGYEEARELMEDNETADD